jgi:glutaredoxin 3
MSKVEIYTTTTCPYCVSAKALLRNKNVDFEEIHIATEEERQQMMQRADGRRTVPQIFIDNVGVGGADDLMRLNKEGKLDAMLGLAKSQA